MRNKELSGDGLTTTDETIAIDKVRKLSLRGDIRGIGVHVEATPTFSSGSGNTLQFIKLLQLLGNGSTPLYEVKNYSATVETIPDIHRVENAVVVQNQALSTTNLTEGKIFINCMRMRAIWKSMNLKVQSYTCSELGLTSTGLTLTFKIIVFYAIVPYSVRLKSYDLASATSQSVSVPSNEGVMTGVLLKTSTANYITTVKLEDPLGANVIDASFDTLQVMQSVIDKQTPSGDGQNFVYFEVPDMPVDENTTIDVVLETAQAMQCYVWYKSALQNIKDGTIPYRNASYGDVPASGVAIKSLKKPSEQIDMMKSHPFATVLNGQHANIEQRDNLTERN